ncbi:hypothetical protein SGCOL_005830 [Colletotrichum sp. CLE4]
MRRLSEESIRTELCEGPIVESPTRPSTPETDTDADAAAAAVTSDRAELIERLKRGESPTWIPNRRVASPRNDLVAHNITKLESLFNNLPRPSTPQSPRPPSSSSSLLPPASITPDRAAADGSREEDERLREGLSIQRPRSALHSGDFTEDHQPRPRSQHEKQQTAQEQETHGATNKFLASRNSWLATSPPRDFSPFQFETRLPFPATSDDYRSVPSSLSSSFSSSFVYKPPTSPLVQSESNDQIDLSAPLNSIAITPGSPSFVGPSRRHTLNSVTSSPFAFPSPGHAAIHRQSSHRGSAALPYQAHQPRRSLTSIPQVPLPGGSSPQTPAAFLRPRRPSFNSDTSPLQHASMVGSYEESILRGRMSTTPSKPLDFLAQIGVLGLGKCKSSLRCPAHVTLPFPAVFYSYGGASQGRVRSEDGPSPYVGQIDLENGLPNPEEGQRSKRKMQSRYVEKRIAEDDVLMADGPALAADGSSDREARRAAQRARRRSASPRAPPGGSYRIPEKGQIQIIIKNPNKTAVKLFLVPYDLAGMEPGTKTFIRQRSYSAGPIMETNTPGLEEAAAAAAAAAAADRPILRYLVHLHICCPSKGRFYLYKSVRIVFANRVPDGKEKLRNETTNPEPRFTPYKPIRVMHPPMSSSHSGPAATLAAEKAFRRRSAGFPLVPSAYPYAVEGGCTPDGFSQSPQAAGYGQQQSSPSPFSFGGNTQPVEAVPFALSVSGRGRARLGSDVSDTTNTTSTTTPGILSPQSEQASRPTTKDGWGDAQVARYEKLSKGDVGYGGNAFAPSSGRSGSPGGAAEGLLSQRLRSLGVQNQGRGQGQGHDQEQGEMPFGGRPE